MRFLVSRERRLLTLSCLSVCLFFGIYQRVCSHWTDFDEIWYWLALQKSVEKFQIWLKSGKNNGPFLHEGLSVFLLLAAIIAAQQYRERTAVLPLHSFQYLLHCWQRHMCVNNTNRMRYYVSTATICTRTRHNFTLYIICILCLC